MTFSYTDESNKLGRLLPVSIKLLFVIYVPPPISKLCAFKTQLYTRLHETFPYPSKQTQSLLPSAKASLYRAKTPIGRTIRLTKF